ncbi:MAG: ABC transporter permease, partial [Planctomycetota bacterium]
MQNKNYGIFVLLLGIILVAGIANPLFVGADNLSTLIRDTSLYGLISIGVAVVIVTGGIDLSIGSLIAFSGVVFGLLLNPHEVTVQQSGKVAAVQRVNVSDLAPAQLPDM